MLASLSRFNDSGVPTAVNLSVDVGPSHLSPPSPALGARDAAMDTGIVTPLLLSLLAGSATGIGGLIVLFGPCSNPSDTTISYALSFAAGVMTTVSIQDLWWPLAVRSQSDFWIATLWLVVGAALARAFNYLPVPDPEALVVASFASEAGGAALRLPGGGTTVSTPHSAAAKRTSAWRLGFLLTVVLTVHNFPEGLLVGVGAVKSLELGLTLCAAIMLHNVAEGIVVAVPVLAGTGSKSTALMLTVFSGMSEPVGAVLGVLFLRTWFASAALEGAINACLCGVGGLMVGVSFLELLPQAWRFGSASTHGDARALVAAQIAGVFAAGMAVMVVTTSLL